MARHRCVIPLRWNDFDVLQHVNNVRYFEFMQDARVSILAAAGAEVVGLTAIGHYVVHQEIDYLRPIELGTDAVTVEVSVAKLGGASYTLLYDLLDHTGRCCAKGETLMGCVDTATQAVTRLPAAVREALTPYLD